jgi:hypothetical protein
MIHCNHYAQPLLSKLKPVQIETKNAPTMRIQNPDLDTGVLTKGLGNIPSPAEPLPLVTIPAQ